MRSPRAGCLGVPGLRDWHAEVLGATTTLGSPGLKNAPPATCAPEVPESRDVGFEGSGA